MLLQSGNARVRVIVSYMDPNPNQPPFRGCVLMPCHRRPPGRPRNIRKKKFEALSSVFIYPTPRARHQPQAPLSTCPSVAGPSVVVVACSQRLAKLWKLPESGPTCHQCPGSGTASVERRAPTSPFAPFLYRNVTSLITSCGAADGDAPSESDGRRAHTMLLLLHRRPRTLGSPASPFESLRSTAKPREGQKHVVDFPQRGAVRPLRSLTGCLVAAGRGAALRVDGSGLSACGDGRPAVRACPVLLLLVSGLWWPGSSSSSPVIAKRRAA